MRHSMLLNDSTNAPIGTHGVSRFFPEDDELLSEVHQSAKLLVDLGKLTVEQRQDMFARRLPAVA
jgi:hypothetical protein